LIASLKEKIWKMNAADRNLFNPAKRVLRQFGALWIVFFAALAARQEFHHHAHLAAIVLAVLAVTVGPLGIAWPAAIKPVFVGWMALAYPIGWLVSRIVLGIIFYGLFTPLAWIFRIMGRDALALKPKPAAASYWHEKPAATDQAQYLHQF
jgi:Saxitoxin biosynthesis operon protein SxtJ